MIQYLYDDGCPPGKRRKHPEDGILWNPNGDGGVIGVADGVGFYSGEPPLHSGLTQGELATRTVGIAFAEADVSQPIAQTLVAANTLVGIKAMRYGLTLDAPEHLPGADIGAVQIIGDKVIAVNTSDCGVLLAMKDGTVWVAPNQSLAYEQEVERIFAEIKMKHAGNLKAAWDEWLPIRREMIRAYGNKKVPNGWAIINGEPGFVGLWQEFVFPRDEVALAICYTDGFTTIEDTANPEAMGKKWVELYYSSSSHSIGGLPAILARSRAKQGAKLPQSHEANLPEATAIAISIME